MDVPEGAIVTGGQRQEERNLLTTTTVLGFALEDALADLVKAHGPGYLDTFLERRLRRTMPQFRALEARAPAFANVKASNDAAEQALRKAVDNVRADPTPLT